MEGKDALTDILSLTGKDLEKELDRIIKTNPPVSRAWTQKELEVLRRLRAAHVPAKKIAEVLDRSLASIQGKY